MVSQFLHAPMLVAVCLISLFISDSSQALLAQESSLLKLVPPDANALVIIKAEALKTTPLAIDRGWFQKRLVDHPGQEIAIPPTAQEIVVASRLNTSHDLSTVWDLGLVSSSATIPVHAIAQAEQGYVDWIGSSQIVWSPANAYFIALDLTTLGILYPADRQLASKWIEWTKSRTSSGLSSYLETAAQKASSTQQIVIALDLKDIPQPHRLKAILSRLPMLKDNPGMIEKWQELLVGIRGLTIKLSVNKDIMGEMTVDFDDNPSILAPYEKQLVITALDRYGASLTDLDDWAFRTNSSSIVATGKISSDGFRRIMSLMEIPSTQYDDTYSHDEPNAAPNTPETKQVSAEDIKLKTSKAYFDALTTLMNDLRKSKDVNTHNYMLWYERYAKKIDALPILNVDDDLLNFGSSVANTFRDIALAKRTAGINANVRRTQATAYVSNYDYLPTNELTAINADEKAPSYVKMYDSWTQMDADIASLRRTMTNRYGVEF